MTMALQGAATKPAETLSGVSAGVSAAMRAAVKMTYGSVPTSRPPMAGAPEHWPAKTEAQQQ